MPRSSSPPPVAATPADLAFSRVRAAAAANRLATIAVEARRARDFAWAPSLRERLVVAAGELGLSGQDLEAAWSSGAFPGTSAASDDARATPPGRAGPDGDVPGPTGPSSHTSLSSQDSLDDVTPLSTWPEPPEAAAYRGILGEFVEALEPHTEADPVALAMSLLVGFGNLVGRSAYVVAESDRHYGSEFALLVGATAKGRKGTSLGRVKSVLDVADPEWVKDRVVTGLSSGEGVVWGVRDPISKHEPIKEKGRVVGYQDVVVDPGVSDKRLLVVEPEFASVLKRINREGNTLSAVLREGWDHGGLATLTKNNPAKATGAHLSVLAHVTKSELLSLMAENDVVNGFLNRFLIVAVRRSKLLPDGGAADEARMKAIAWKLRDAAVFAREVGEVRRDAAASALWRTVYPELSEGLPGLLGAATGRAEAHVLRLSLLYALLDKSPTIGEPQLRAAIAMWEYCFRSARYVFGDALTDPIAETVRRHLRESGDAGATKSEIYERLGRHVKKSALDAALVTLDASQLAWREIESTAGRPRERWFAGSPAKKAKKAKEGGGA